MMKKITLFIFLLTFFVFQFGNAQVNKNFDANAAWNSFMGWTGSSTENIPDWAIPDLVVLLDTDANTATLKPNRVNDVDPYWISDPATDLFGLNTMSASVFVSDDALAATNFNFVGNVLSNDLDSGFTSQAFIKVFNADYSAILVDLLLDLTPGNFSLNYDGTAAGAAHVQYGFITVGLNVNPTSAFDAQYDALGSVVVTSQVLSVEDKEISTFSSYPNPTKDFWTIKSKNINMTAINVFDILGKNVLSLAPNSSEATINARSLKSGLYFAKVETANGSSSVKLVKQ